MTNNENGKTQERKKNTRRYGLFAVLFVLIVTLAGGLVYAQKIKKRMDNGPLFFMMEKISKDLDLNDNQKAELDKIREEIKTKMENRKKEREKGFSDFENAFKQDKLDKQTLLDLDSKREADRKEMKEFFMDELIKFHAILTPEQRTKAVDKMKEMKEHMHDGFHRGDKDKKGPGDDMDKKGPPEDGNVPPPQNN